VTQSQASELTLTVTEAAVRPIQVWVRTAGRVDAARSSVTAMVSGQDARRVKVGQRIRAFSPQSRSRMYQATVADVTARDGGVAIRAAIVGQTVDGSSHYVLEIVTEEGEYLSVPNEAILESTGTHVVYTQEPDTGYVPKEIEIGVRGELFTQVVRGLEPGQQVVTIGSFFIDAEHRLKGP
jgi:hypothetical protein